MSTVDDRERERLEAELQAGELPELPPSVQLTLHNVDPASPIPGDQIAFRCFHDGDLRALAFAAGMPWLDLHLARRKRGWRPRSRGPKSETVARRGWPWTPCTSQKAAGLARHSG